MSIAAAPKRAARVRGWAELTHVLAPRARTKRVTGVALALAALVPLAAYVWVAAHRLGYPYELDWMEGGSVELAGRVLAGHSLYAPPSLSFVGWAYPPLYYWVTAAVAKVAGLGFFPLRLVSTLSALAAMATLGSIVVRESGDRIAALLAAGLFAATYKLSGSWFDVGRVDSLFVALTLVALAWGVRARDANGGALLGVLAFLAFFTKQTALIAIAPALLYLVLTRRRVGVAAAVTLAALVVSSTVIADALTGGWYRYYVFSELAGQAWVSQLWLEFWRHDILSSEWPLAALLALTGASWAMQRRPRRRLAWSNGYWLAAAAGLLAAAWISRLHTGGYRNVLIPAYAATALLAGLALAAARRRSGAISAVAGGLVVAQLALLIYSIGGVLPSARDRIAGAELIARLRALPGPVLVLRHPWYAAEVGKGNFAQGEAIGDVIRSAAPRGRRALRPSLQTALETERIQAVVLDGKFDANLFGSALRRDFRLQSERVTRTPLYPLTDTPTAPTLVYLRRARSASR